MTVFVSFIAAKLVPGNKSYPKMNYWIMCFLTRNFTWGGWVYVIKVIVLLR